MLLQTLLLWVGDYLSTVWWPAVAGAVKGIVVHLLMIAMAPESTFGGELMRLVTGAACGAAVYCSFVWSLWRLVGRPYGAEMILLQQLRAWIARRRSPDAP